MIGMVAAHQEKVAGYMVYGLRRYSLELHKMAAHPGYGRQGVGQALMEKLKSKLDVNRRTRIVMLVRESDLNTLSFLKAQGFVPAHLTREYYDDTQEDAIEMVYTLPKDLASKEDSAGLEEEVWIPTVEELEKSADPNARQLAQEARAAGYSHVVLIPKALSENADFEELVVTLFAQESVVTKAMAVLTPEKGLTLRAYPYYIPSQAGRVAEFLRDHITEEVQTPVIALDAAFEGAVGQILPANHPLTLLMDAEEHHLMPYRKAIATLFTNPPKEGLRNLILRLSRGSVRPVTIGGRDYTAIFA